ncbi:MAG: carbonic anhydrase [Hyphomicrobiaceae bacterium]
MTEDVHKTPGDLLAQNKRWAAARLGEDPNYFGRLKGLQTPRFLWIGCADSRVPANVITGLDPGEVFVHRNVANMVYPADLNCMSVLQFAVEALKVSHIIVCGHYGCGGVRAAVDGIQHGLIDHWLEPIRDLNREHKDVLRSLPNDEARQDCLCELNVRAQTRTVINAPIIQRAWDRGQTLSVHGWIYGLANGLLKDLDCGKESP